MSTLNSMSMNEKERTECVGRARRRKSSVRRGSNIEGSSVNAKQVQRRSLSQFEVVRSVRARDHFHCYIESKRGVRKFIETMIEKCTLEQ